VLGALMIAGADVDARTFLLPDTVTFGAAVAGIVAAPLLDPTDPWLAGVSAVARAFGCAAVLALLRSSYARTHDRARDTPAVRCVLVSITMGNVLCQRAIQLTRARELRRYPQQIDRRNVTRRSRRIVHLQHNIFLTIPAKV
jgi:hypothetical protein